MRISTEQLFFQFLYTNVAIHTPEKAMPLTAGWSNYHLQMSADLLQKYPAAYFLISQFLSFCMTPCPALDTATDKETLYKQINDEFETLKNKFLQYLLSSDQKEEYDLWMMIFGKAPIPMEESRWSKIKRFFKVD